MKRVVYTFIGGPLDGSAIEDPEQKDGAVVKMISCNPSGWNHYKVKGRELHWFRFTLPEKKP